MADSEPIAEMLESAIRSDSAVAERMYLATIGVSLVTGAFMFIKDYQSLKKSNEEYILQAKCASLKDCREYFLRPPSSILQWVKVIYTRLALDIIGIFYESDNLAKDTEMKLCAFWSLIILAYLFLCQKAIFTVMVIVYACYQIVVHFSSPSESNPGSRTSSALQGSNENNAEQKYEMMREACSGNLKSFNNLMKAAENGDHVAAGFVIFILTSNESNIDPDIEKATRIARENLDVFFDASNNGDIFAQATMAFLFMRGIHIPRDDTKALEYGLKSIKTGHPYANLILGWVYLARDEKDPENSYKYLKMAAKRGLASAQNSMGALNLIESDKYKQNPKKALYWFKQAALQNLRGAEYNLGALYNSDLLLDCEPSPSIFSFGSKSRKELREGLRNDAVFWLMLASQHGHRLADAELRKAESSLND